MTVFTGTSGDDVLVGTSGGDIFQLQAGGGDKAIGGLGDDMFNLGGTLGTRDQIKGGKGVDIVILDGDYSSGLTISDTMLASIEQIKLTEGHDYDLTLSNAMVDQRQGAGFNVMGYTLDAHDQMRIDASAIDHGANIALYAGAGDDLLIGASVSTSFVLTIGGDDTAFGGAGDDFFLVNNAFTAGDRIDGGGGRDQIQLSDDSAPIVLGGEAIRDIEAVSLFLTGHFDLSATDDLLDSGESLVLTVQQHSSFSFDGSAETDGWFDLGGSWDEDQMIGGAMADHLSGDVGGDTLQGGGGADILSGGRGHDWFVYASTEDSAVGGPDTIADLENIDTIDLSAIDADTTQAGDQKFHLVAAFTHHAGQLVLAAGDGVTQLLADVDGDGVADMQIDLQGDHGDFTHFRF